MIAAGYLAPDRLANDIAQLRSLTSTPFGVNVFVAGAGPADSGVVEAYAARLTPLAEQAGVALGTPRHDDDDFEAKIALLLADPVAVVSFTFGAPPADVVGALRGVGSEVWITVTSPAEAEAVLPLGPDALVVQGVEAGGHRGVFGDDAEQSDLTLLVALQLIRARTAVPLVGAGGIATGAALAAVLAAGACAGQVGSALLRSAEADTSEIQRTAVAQDRRTVLTRAFSGRTARSLDNRWHEQFGALAPAAYPEVHHLTAPLRAHGRAHGDVDLVNLWAGQAHGLAQARSATEIVAEMGREAREALRDASAELERPPGPAPG